MLTFRITDHTVERAGLIGATDHYLETRVVAASNFAALAGYLEVDEDEVRRSIAASIHETHLLPISESSPITMVERSPILNCLEREVVVEVVGSTRNGKVVE